jgi:hypothetical protein
MHVFEVRNAELLESITQQAAVPAHEQIVFEQFPDEDAPAGRGRLNDTRVAARHPAAAGPPSALGLGS